MIKLHPGERATVEELKEYPWFGGIDWDEVTYGPTAERKCIRPMVHLMSVLVLICVYRELQAAQRPDQSVRFPCILDILRQSFRVAEVPGGGGSCADADGYVRGRAIRFCLSASRGLQLDLKWAGRRNPHSSPCPHLHSQDPKKAPRLAIPASSLKRPPHL